MFPILQMDSLPSEPPGKPVLVSGVQQSDSVIHIYVCTHVCARAQSLQSCLTLCNPLDYSPPGSSVPGILQAKILESAAISFSKA